ncbi:hypothetical protein PMAYCL1PPCAC_10150, partial [Pristionchus mayeri]
TTVAVTVAPPAQPQSEASSNGRTIKRPAPFDPSSFENQNGMGPPRKVRLAPPSHHTSHPHQQSSHYLQRPQLPQPQPKPLPPPPPPPPSNKSLNMSTRSSTRAAGVSLLQLSPPEPRAPPPAPKAMLPPPIPVKTRTVITDQQKEALKFVFAHEQHPSLTTIEQLAEKLNMSVKTVQNWFHNHRTRA